VAHALVRAASPLMGTPDPHAKDKGNPMTKTSREPKSSAGKRTKLGLALQQSAKQTLAHVKGEIQLPTRRRTLRSHR
jgi:hypothetical protein